MPLTVHPDAAARAQELALRALDTIEVTPVIPRQRQRLEAAPAGDMPVAAVIGPDDILGPVTSSRTDRFGREIERTYGDRERMLTLRGDGYQFFQRSSEILHSQRTLRQAVTLGAVSKAVFEWVCTTKINGPGQTLVDFVLPALSALVKDFEVIIPVHGLHAPEAVEIGNVTICDISAAEMNEWRSRACRAAPQHVDDINKMHDEYRKRFQGRAAARFTATAEFGHAVDRATEQADLSIALLRLISIGAFAPEKPSHLALAGREGVTRGAYLVLGPNDSFQSGEYIEFPEEQRPWWMTGDDLRRIPQVLGHWSALLRKEERSQLERICLASALIYSRATRSRIISEKLIHMFAAIESLLLRSETEPISSAVADRVAFCVGRTADERMAIVRNFREAYAMRSKYVHHAVDTPPDAAVLEALEAFFVTTAQFFINLRDLMARYATKEDMIEAIERRKYT